MEQEHDPETVNHCAVQYLLEVKRRRASLTWTREQYRQTKDDFDEMCSSPLPGYAPAVKAHQDKVSKAYILLEESRDRLAREIAESMAFLSQAHDICFAEGGDLYEMACYMHYVEDKKWKDLEKPLGYSYSHLTNDVRTKGLQRIYDKMPEEFRRDTIPSAGLHDASKARLAENQKKPEA